MYRPVGELLKSWVHGCLIQACFVGHRKDALMHPCTQDLTSSPTGLFRSFTASRALSWLRRWTSNWINVCIYVKKKQTKTNKQKKTTCNKGRADRGLGWGENGTICLLSNVIRIGEEDTTKRKKVTITSSKKNKQKKAVDLHVSLLLAGCLSRIQDNTEPGA